MPTVAPQWSSRFAFLMAAIGSAVGLGNLWRFPFYTGQHGGAAFVVVYLLCVAFFAYPILVGELAVGRHQGLSAVGSMSSLAFDSGASRRWAIGGWLGLAATLMVLMTYSVVAGQVVAYAVSSFIGDFSGATAQGTALHAPLYSSTALALFWHAAFCIVTMAVVAGGLHGGIERVVTVLMPAFFVVLVGLCIYALATGAAREAITYLFAPDFSAISPSTVLAGMSQAFYSIGVGAGIMITYGSFLPREQNLGNNGLIVAGADTLVAVISGLMIFPVVYAFGLDPQAGSSLIFDALPAVFAGMPAGAMVGGLFFLLAAIAALTTTISGMIALVMLGQEQFRFSRAQSVVIFGGIGWAIGALTIGFATLRDWLDFLSGSVLLPLGGLLLAVFVGWVVPRDTMRQEMHNTNAGLFRYWRICVRWLAPASITVILLLGIDERFELGIAAGVAALAG